jgi:hypothetical protein
MRKPRVSKEELEDFVAGINECLYELGDARKVGLRRGASSEWVVTAVSRNDTSNDPIYFEMCSYPAATCLAWLRGYYRGLLVERLTRLPV